MVTGEPPSTLDGGQCKVTVDFEAEVKVKLEGGAGGTPLFRLTVKGNRYVYVRFHIPIREQIQSDAKKMGFTIHRFT